MKNKEIEELLNNIKEQIIIDERLGKEIAQDFHKTTLNYKKIKILLSYIEQLENNRDKAIEYVESHFIFNDETGECYQTYTFDKDNVKELYDILKGDSDYD